MDTKTKFIESAKNHLDALGAELSQIDAKLGEAGLQADAWTSDQAAKLKNDWQQAKDEMSRIADRIENEGEEAVTEARQKAESHWKALQAAVKTYRNHLETGIAN